MPGLSVILLAHLECGFAGFSLWHWELSTSQQVPLLVGLSVIFLGYPTLVGKLDEPRAQVLELFWDPSLSCFDLVGDLLECSTWSHPLSILALLCTSC